MASGWLAISPWNRTSPERPGSATATAILALCVSNPTHTDLSSPTARLPCLRLGTGLPGATLVERHDQRRATPIHDRDMGSRRSATAGGVRLGRSGRGRQVVPEDLAR